MSIDTDSVSRFGANKGGADKLALFLKQFGGMVIEAYLESMDFKDLQWVMSARGSKSREFPVIGKKRDGAEHIPGEEVRGGTVQSGTILVEADPLVYDAVFIAEFDELLSQFAVAGPYATQLGQSLGVLRDKRVAITHVLASRKAAGDMPPDAPTPSYSYPTDMKTSAAQLEAAMWAAAQYHRENDLTGQTPKLMLPHAQVLLLARNFGLTSTDVSRPQAGSGDRVEGTVGKIVGFGVDGTNNIPKVNITTGNTKYRGDFSTTVGVLTSKRAVGTLEYRGMKIVKKTQDERFGTLMIASEVKGHGILQAENAYELATAVRA